MKKLILLILFLVNYKNYAQNGNEWIEYGQENLKITIDSTGIYKLTYKDLIDNKFDVSKFNPKFLKLYFEGKEVAFKITGENDNIFDETDYIEFFGIKNSGDLDDQLFLNQKKPHNYYSIYSDKSAYFLTKSNTIGKRITPIIKSIIQNKPETAYLHKEIKVYSSNYSRANYNISLKQSAAWESDEFLCSQSISYSDTIKNSFVDSLKINNFVFNSKLKIDFFVFSQKFTKKTLKYWINDKSNTFEIDNYNFKNILDSTNFDSKINNNLKFKIQFESTSDNTKPFKNDQFALGYLSIEYLKSFSKIENDCYTLLPNSDGQSIINFQNVNTLPLALEVSDVWNPNDVLVNQNPSIKGYQIIVNNTNKSKKLAVYTNLKSPLKLEFVIFKKATKNSFDYLIFTHKTLRDGAQKYAQYRASLSGGSFIPNILETDDIYNEYSYGMRSPLAIIRAVKNLRENNSIKYIFFIGKGYTFPTGIRSRESWDLVPSLGEPASDRVLISGFKNEYETIPHGRLGTIYNEDVLNYLNKVMLHENGLKNSSLSNKRMLFLSGGNSESQIIDFKNYMTEVSKISKNGIIGAQIEQFAKKSTTNEDIDLSKQINEGVGVLTFLGHSNFLVLDLNIGIITEKNEYQNNRKFPFLMLNGCTAGAIFANTIDRKYLTLDWIFAKNKGAINVLSHTWYSFSNTNMVFTDAFYNFLNKDKENANLSIGNILKNVSNTLLQKYPNDPLMVSNIEHLLLQGDPAIKLFNFTEPDFQLNNSKVILHGIKKNETIEKNENLTIGFQIENLGLYEKNKKINYTISIKETNGTFQKIEKEIPNVSFSDTIFHVFKNNKNIESIEIEVNKNKIISELSYTNNIAKFYFNWQEIGKKYIINTTIDIDKVSPILNVTLDNKKIFEKSIAFKNQILNFFLIDNFTLPNKDFFSVSYRKICENCEINNFIPLINNISFTKINEAKIEIELKNFEVGKYEFLVQGIDNYGNNLGKNTIFKIEIIENNKLYIKNYPNPVTLFTNFDIFVPLNNFEMGPVKCELNIIDFSGKIIEKKIFDITKTKSNLYWIVPSQLYNYSGLLSYVFKFEPKTNIKSISGKLLLKK